MTRKLFDMNKDESQTVPVSVVIPAFRAAATIDRAIRSVYLQDRLPEQLIVVDDASGDDTAAAAARAAECLVGTDVRIIRLARNEGAAAARNRGWEEATAPFIAFLDADDFWHPAKLGLQWRWMADNPHVAATGHTRVWGLGSGRAVNIARIVDAMRLNRNDVLYRSLFVTPSVMLKSDLPFRFDPNFRRAEDHLLWSQIVLNALPVFRLEVPLVVLGKAPWGAGGLSADVWAMWRARAAVTRRLRELNLISTSAMTLSMARTWLFTASCAVRSPVYDTSRAATSARNANC